ncbi:hypothetical protein BYT27DRAFT_7259124 [Phlegmacium glaucopus]|nr:hypothetical protein BYT27DRAFT_7259124 [Phlegmacium glaucopus]
MSSNALNPPSSSLLASSEPSRKTSKSSQLTRASQQTAIKPSLRVNKMTNAVAMHGIQGTINCLTDVFKKSITSPLDPRAAQQSEAVQPLQAHAQDGLTVAERTKMVKLFAADHVTAEIYVDLIDDELAGGCLEKSSSSLAIGPSISIPLSLHTFT